MERKRLKPRSGRRRRRDALEHPGGVPSPERPTSLQAIMQRQVGSPLTQDLTERFCRYVREGVPFDTICGLLGIHSCSFHRWRDWGQKYIDGDCQPAKHAIYGHFAWELRKAYAVYIKSINRKLHKQGKWFRELMILERRDPKTYAKQRDGGGGQDETPDPDERFI